MGVAPRQLLPTPQAKRRKCLCSVLPSQAVELEAQPSTWAFCKGWLILTSCAGWTTSPGSQAARILRAGWQHGSKREEDGILRVQRWLSPVRCPAPDTYETQPIHFLRKFSNYLAPRKGLLSADTWSIFSVWLRNTVLNQIVFWLLLASLLGVPKLIFRVFQSSWFQSGEGWIGSLAIAITAVLAVLIGLNLSHFDHDPRPGRGDRRRAIPAVGRIRRTVHGRIRLLDLEFGRLSPAMVAPAKQPTLVSYVLGYFPRWPVPCSGLGRHLACLLFSTNRSHDNTGKQHGRSWLLPHPRPYPLL